ncbi:MBL fold metallo-hydrolase [Pectobacteriaceae bacterium CE70]|nr:MBL fold metallo-hydrolase [Pectobacteriaceae bacterium C52]WJV67753.1 MBL fold metallo-hydrolase [Pectobacteriaceae bacterium CE70]WJY11695.1 MBL fold metallo-hydrolase [Pectobacteriaceae bacterium C80]
MTLHIEGFFDTATSTVSYVLYDQAGGHAAIIDPVLDYDPKSGRTHTASADKLIDYLVKHNLTVDWLLETHAHADHLSAAHYLRDQVGGKIAISEKIVEVQKIFKDIFNIERTFLPDGSQFDHLLKDGEMLSVGQLSLQAMHVPGHTPADMAFHIDDAIFLGDTLFMPDVGTARCDFPGGDAQALYRSISKILSFPADTRLYVCHDYPPSGRGPLWKCTVAEQRAHNIHVHDGVDEAAFVALRHARDETLPMPTLLLPSVQVNIRAGTFPPAEENGVSYLKIPLNRL